MVIKSICGMCQGGCHVDITLENGKITRVQPDKTSSRGRVCVRGALAPEILYSSERLTTPLIRDGERGEGKFRRATWEEAFDHAAMLLNHTIEKYEAKSLASYLGRGVLGTPVGRILLNLNADSIMKRLGSPNAFSCSSICNTASSKVAPVTTLGVNTGVMVQDILNSDYIFSWGKNSTTDDGPQMTLKTIKAAKEKGAKLIVIDPRGNGIGELADLWIPVIPGSDGAFALAMLKLIVDTERYDKEFVQKYTLGFDELKEYLNSLQFEQLSEWCGVPFEKIQEVTDIFCSTEKISLISYTGLEYQLSAIQNSRAIFTLWAITGKLDVEGGIYLDAEKISAYQLKNLPVGNEPIGIEEFPLFYRFQGEGQFCRFPRAVLEGDPYPAKGLIIVGGSPVLSFPDSNQWREAYKELSCLIVIDRYMTEDARFADVVFPACTLFERYRPVLNDDGEITLVDPVISPVGECRDDVLILSGIAKRLGVGDDYPETDAQLREWLCGIFPPDARDFGRKKKERKRIYKKYKSGYLREDGQPGFPTPSGKFEICSTILRENGFTPYPKYQDIRSIPKFNKTEYPFIMTTGARSNHRMGVFGVNIPEIAKVEPYPYMDISSKNAEELGVADGDWAKITTPFGKGKFKVRVCAMAYNCIHIPHGGGSAYMAEAWKKGNVNELTSLEYNDPITGFVAMKSVPCRVEKAE